MCLAQVWFGRKKRHEITIWEYNLIFGVLVKAFCIGMGWNAISALEAFGSVIGATSNTYDRAKAMKTYYNLASII